MAQVIRPEDFNKNTTDKLRSRWTVKQMDALIKALDGARVFVELDKHTGHTWEVSLVRTATGHHPGKVLAVGDGTPQGTWYSLADIGVVLDTRYLTRTKWDALDIFAGRREVSAV